MREVIHIRRAIERSQVPLSCCCSHLLKKLQQKDGLKPCPKAPPVGGETRLQSLAVWLESSVPNFYSTLPPVSEIPRDLKIWLSPEKGQDLLVMPNRQLSRIKPPVSTFVQWGWSPPPSSHFKELLRGGLWKCFGIYRALEKCELFFQHP